MFLALAASALSPYAGQFSCDLQEVQVSTKSPKINANEAMSVFFIKLLV